MTPSNTRAYNNLGSVYAQQKDLSRAIELFQKAISLDSSYSDAWYNLGMAYSDQGNRDTSRKFFRRAAALGNGPAREEVKKEN